MTGAQPVVASNAGNHIGVSSALSDRLIHETDHFSTNNHHGKGRALR